MKSKKEKRMTGIVAVALGVLAASLPACEDRLTDVQRVEGDMFVIRALLIDGYIYPETQFHLAPADRCDDFHWHRPVGQAISIGTPGAQSTVVCHQGNHQRRIDPDLGGCGFGKLNERPPLEWRVHRDCFSAWEALFR